MGNRTPIIVLPIASGSSSVSADINAKKMANENSECF